MADDTDAAPPRQNVDRAMAHTMAICARLEGEPFSVVMGTLSVVIADQLTRLPGEEHAPGVRERALELLNKHVREVISEREGPAGGP